MQSVAELCEWADDHGYWGAEYVDKVLFFFFSFVLCMFVSLLSLSFASFIYLKYLDESERNGLLGYYRRLFV